MPTAVLAAPTIVLHPAMPVWPHDDTASKNAFFGNFHAADWQTKYLTRITPPFQMYYDKKLMSSILVNRMVAPALLSIFNEIWNACDHDQAKVNATGASDFGGCFNIRPISGSDNWSNHSWAIAIDLSPSSNGFNVQKTTLGKIVVDTFKAHGWRWGGDYKGRRDPMHFEAVRS
jgi:hypothetical protein